MRTLPMPLSDAGSGPSEAFIDSGVDIADTSAVLDWLDARQS